MTWVRDRTNGIGRQDVGGYVWIGREALVNASEGTSMVTSKVLDGRGVRMDQRMVRKWFVSLM